MRELIDDSIYIEEESMLLDYMDEIKEEALRKLSNLEIAAIYNDFFQFQVRYREEMEHKKVEWSGCDE